ncbi:DUF2270 domain-containing protein [Mesorhizobium sp. KR9-304]|jgi:uncharacterized membrane protein|uniref:DUF2270 domain-containing protein n=1 Tax=Mesorhizobium sp. KR9-304 TaxID=3156614 RepID=UPI0032B37FCD
MDNQLPSQLSQGPLSSNEFVTTVAHFHRAEIARMAGWRDRIDRTTNWAITVVAAMLSLSLSTSSAHHGVLIFAMLLIMLLLWIEARRYRFFDVYRARVRQLERHYFAQLFSPQPDHAANWLAILGESLRTPKFHISHWTAFARRLRRNYIHMFAIVLFAWVLKISTPSLQSETTGSGGLVATAAEAVNNAALGPLPGWLVVAAVAAFYVALFLVALTLGAAETDVTEGDVHV